MNGLSLRADPDKYRSGLIFEYNLEIEQCEHELSQHLLDERQLINTPVSLPYNKAAYLRQKIRIAKYHLSEIAKWH